MAPLLADGPAMGPAMGPPARTGRVVLSAHLDDAVFSCWHAISDRGVSAPVTVATVLAGLPPPGQGPGRWDGMGGATDPVRRVRERRDDDVAALSFAGAHAVHMDFFDEQHRDGPPPTRAIIEAIEELCDPYQEVWIPAAIGGNKDHVLISRAAVAATRGLRRFLYADLPYATGHDWSSLVAAAGRRSHDDRSLKAQLEASPFIPPGSVPGVHRLTVAEQEGKRAAVHRYRSELELLRAAFGAWYDEPEVAEAELYWELEEAPPAAPVWQSLGARRPAVGAPDDEPHEEPGEVAARPFLSVLTRTQGDRPGALAEVVASLARQTCQDFEVLLLFHDVSPAAMDDVRAQVEAMPASLAGRIRTIEVAGGGRGRPLNVGVTAACGRYVAVLDDDDLVAPDWVERFHRLGTRHPGRVLRARMAFLRREAGWWKVQYLFAEDFDLVDHLVINESAVCGLAYPLSCFTEMGLRFDEGLPVVEDWDVLLTAAPLCGVAATAAVTSFYRDWGTGEDSHSLVTAPQWRSAERAVIAKADRLPLVMPPGSASALREERLELRRHRDEIRAMEDRLRDLEADHRARITELQSAHASEVAEVTTQLHLTHRRLEEVVEEFRTSTSWRVTAPLRALAALRGRLAGGDGSTADERAEPAAPPPGRPEDAPASYPASYFEALYTDDPDPWGFATRWYERRKYAITLASLPRERYRRVFEPACSIGVLSQSLARRCDRLVASDSAPTAVEQARQRLRAHPHVDVEVMEVPAQWPQGRFDLIVLSEFAFFLDDADLATLVERTVSSLDDDGHVVAVHYLPAGRIVQSADEVHAALGAHPDLVGTVTHREPEFVLDVFVRREG